MKMKNVSFVIKKRKEDSKYLIRFTTFDDSQNSDNYVTVKEYDETMELDNPRNKENFN
nr:hypothetical protein GTC16762_11500 [Pigmentibacter ruber]